VTVLKKPKFFLAVIQKAHVPEACGHEAGAGQLFEPVRPSWGCRDPAFPDKPS